MLVEKENGNRVKIEGILSEIDLKYGSFQKNGAPMKTISGTIKVRVNLPIKEHITELEIPVHLFASESTNAGKKNPSFESIERIKNEYVSALENEKIVKDVKMHTKGKIIYITISYIIFIVNNSIPHHQKQYRFCLMSPERKCR